LFKYTFYAAQHAFYSIIWGKMHQNAMQNAPKHNAKCTKTQCEMHQNAGQNAPKQQAFCNNMQYTKGHKTLSAD